MCSLDVIHNNNNRVNPKLHTQKKRRHTQQATIHTTLQLFPQAFYPLGGLISTHSHMKPTYHNA